MANEKWVLKGCDSNFKVNVFSNFKLPQMKHLPCIKQYVPGKPLKSINTYDQQLNRHNVLKKFSLIIWYVDFVMTTNILIVHVCEIELIIW